MHNDNAECKSYQNSATTLYNHTPYGGYYGYFIYVYMTGDSNEYTSIYAWHDGQTEEQEIDNGIATSPYKIAEYLQGNGDKVIKYHIPDLTTSTRHVRIATCPKWINTTDKIDPNNPCTFTFAHIRGPASN